MSKIKPRPPLPAYRTLGKRILLTSLGLIPAACQSPISRLTPPAAKSILQQDPKHPVVAKEDVAQTIKQKTKKESIAFETFKEWGKGLRLSVLYPSLLPSMIPIDISFLFHYGSSNKQARSSIFQGSSMIYDHKVPSYTSGLVDNDPIRNTKERNRQIEEQEQKASGKENGK